MRLLPGHRAAHAHRHARCAQRRGQPDDARGHDHLRPGGAQRRDARRDDQRHRIPVAPSGAGRGPRRRGRRPRGGPATRVSRPANEGARQPGPWRRRNGRLDAAHGWPRCSRRPQWRPRAALDDDRRRSDAAAGDPVALRGRRAPAHVDAARGDAGRHELGRPPLLHPRVGKLSSPYGRHEHPHRRRHQRRIRLFARGHAGPGRIRGRQRAARRLLRGGHPDHRAGAARQRHGGAGQESDHARAAAAGETAALDCEGSTRRT